MPFLQPGLSLTGYTNGTATGSGSTLAFTGISKALVEGQFFSLVIGGRRYLYSANGAGTTVGVSPLLRVPAAGAVAGVATPMTEGTLSGDEFAWTIAVAHPVGLSFSLAEGGAE